MVTEIADEFHTMTELYEHRRALTVALFRLKPEICWRSKSHHPGDEIPMYEGFFIVGIELPTGSVRYHYELKHWSLFDGITEMEFAPLWDGENSNVERLESLPIPW